jgi:hypothetical protein
MDACATLVLERYQGLRHDSGDPVEWGEKAIAHYEKLGIDPMSKCWSSPIISIWRKPSNSIAISTPGEPELRDWPG